MSLFLNQNDMTLVDVSPQKMELAEFQYDTMTRLLRTVFHDCSMKCIPLDYGEGDLNKAESSCADRCVAKFMQSYRVLGMYVQSQGFKDRDLVHYEEIKRKLKKET